MLYTISTAKPMDLTLQETDPIKSILQNVYLILSTKKKTVPMYRDFGLEMKFIDKPLPAAETLAVQEIRQAIAEFEPRASVSDIEFAQNGAGIQIKVEIKEK